MVQVSAELLENVRTALCKAWADPTIDAACRGCLAMGDDPDEIQHTPDCLITLLSTAISAPTAYGDDCSIHGGLEIEDAAPTDPILDTIDPSWGEDGSGPTDPRDAGTGTANLKVRRKPPPAPREDAMSSPTLAEMIEACDLAIVRPIARQNAINAVRKLLRRLDPDVPENVERVCPRGSDCSAGSEPPCQCIFPRAILRALIGETQ